MLKTPWRPSVDVNPLLRPLSPKPSDLIIRLAWAKEEGCCIGKIEFERNTCEQISMERRVDYQYFTHYDNILFQSTSLKESLLAWRLTFTTSNGLITKASVKPEPSPAADSA